MTYTYNHSCWWCDRKTAVEVDEPVAPGTPWPLPENWVLLRGGNHHLGSIFCSDACLLASLLQGVS